MRDGQRDFDKEVLVQQMDLCFYFCDEHQDQTLNQAWDTQTEAEAAFYRVMSPDGALFSLTTALQTPPCLLLIKMFSAVVTNRPLLSSIIQDIK